MCAELKQQIRMQEAAVTATKARVAAALRQLDEISQDIHTQRSLRKQDQARMTADMAAADARLAASGRNTTDMDEFSAVVRFRFCWFD